MSDKYGHRWMRRTHPTEDGERFALTHTRHSTRKYGQYINFWHVKDGHEYLFTFKPSKRYSPKQFWDVKLFRKLLADVTSPKPSVEVVRYAVDRELIFNAPDFAKSQVPAVPDPPKLPEGWDIHMERMQHRAMRWPFVESPDPAPFILYGVHPNGKKERAWKLTPNNHTLLDVKPGDLVMANTRKGPAPVEVTRIEAASGDMEQPACSVITKMSPLDPLPVRNPKRKNKKQLRRKIEEEKAKEPAPFILYGKFDKIPEEHCWRLTPDKPKREGIEPGDRVLVWTSIGWKQVTVTRIEPAEGKAQPAYRVKKKLTPEEIKYAK